MKEIMPKKDAKKPKKTPGKIKKQSLRRKRKKLL